MEPSDWPSDWHLVRHSRREANLDVWLMQHPRSGAMIEHTRVHGVADADPWVARLARYRDLALRVDALAPLLAAAREDDGFSVWTPRRPDANLRDWLAADQASRHQLMEVLRAVARGLDALAEAGLAHGALQPAWIDRAPGGPQLHGAVYAEAAATTPTALQGAVGYLAPEVVNGKPRTAAADQFALGIVVAESLSGRNPLLASDAWVLAGHKPVPLQNLEDPVRSVVGRALSPAPSDRWQSCSAFLDALDEALEASRPNPA